MNVADLIAVHLRNRRRDEPPRPESALFRCSQSHACHRARCLDALHVAPSDALPTTTLTAFAIGSAYHSLVQAALVAEFPKARTEVVVDFRPRVNLVGHADVVLSRTVIEIKTMQPYAFALATEGIHNRKTDTDAEGPKLEHLVQAGLYALGLDCDRVHMVYVDKGSGRIAEWEHDLDSIVATGRTLQAECELELSELVGLEADLDRGMLPERWVPGFGFVEHLPGRNSRDEPWRCRLCIHRTTCEALPSTAIEVGTLTDAS